MTTNLIELKQNLFPTILETGKSKIKAPVGSGSGEKPFLIHKDGSCYVLKWRKG